MKAIKEKPKNPDAFPSPHFDSEPGMTLRDYFAAKAMQGMLSNSTVMQVIAENYPDQGDEYLANQCYNTADAMLNQRNK